MEVEKQGFEQWAIVELFGHQRIAGKVSEQTIGGCSFVRVDVPTLPERIEDDYGTKRKRPPVAGFTKLYGQGAIYGMTFVDQAIATASAAEMRVMPGGQLHAEERDQIGESRGVAEDARRAERRRRFRPGGRARRSRRPAMTHDDNRKNQVLVPRAPTEEMLAAGFAALADSEGDGGGAQIVTRIYAAMIGAAPQIQTAKPHG